jgi:hypothetical protein
VNRSRSGCLQQTPLMSTLRWNKTHIRRLHVKLTVQSKCVTGDSQSTLETLAQIIIIILLQLSTNIVIRLWTRQTDFISRQESGVPILSLHPNQLCCPCKQVPVRKGIYICGRKMTEAWLSPTECNIDISKKKKSNAFMK